VRTALFFAAITLVFAAILTGPAGSAQGPAAPASVTAAGPHAALVKTYCVSCHNDRTRSGELSLEDADLNQIPQHADTWEKVIRKVRAGMMPPAGMPRPDPAGLDAFVSHLETTIDRAAAAGPRPGRTALHRLNRAEYANAIRDLLALEIDATALLPADDESIGFDNIADVLTVSPSLMERYLSASWNISRMALGNVNITPSTVTYRVRPDLSGSAPRRHAAGHSRRDAHRAHIPSGRRVRDQAAHVAQHLRSDAWDGRSA